MRGTVKERLAAHSTPTASGCREWQRHRNHADYGVVAVDRRSVLAHRAAWAEENGPIPEGMHVLHSCDNPPCINVGHLFLGTNADNVADKVQKSRQSKGTSHARRVRRGEVHYRSKHSDAKVCEVRQLLNLGLSTQEAGCLAGVTTDFAYGIKYGNRRDAAPEKWSWPEGPVSISARGE